MATKQNMTTDLYDYIDETSIDADLICHICHLPYDDPRSTPCDHVFCLECILQWINTNNATCPFCRQTTSPNHLMQVPRPLRNMLDKLPVKCKVCGETGLSRGNFADHINKFCVKYEVPCLLANINCSWSGQRDQLKKHLDTCDARGTLRPIFDQFIAENKELQAKLDECQNIIHQLKSEINQLQNQNKRQDIENEEFKYQETVSKVQIDQQRHQIRLLNEKIIQLKHDNHNRNQQAQQQTKQKPSPMSCWPTPSECKSYLSSF